MTPEDLVAQRLIGLVLSTPDLGPKLAAMDTRIFGGTYREAAEHVKSQYTKETATGASSDPVRQTLEICLQAAAEYEPMDTASRTAEFDRLYARLKLLWVKQHQPKLVAAIKRAEQSGDRERRNRLMEEYTTLTKRLVHAEKG